MDRQHRSLVEAGSSHGTEQSEHVRQEETFLSQAEGLMGYSTPALGKSLLTSPALGKSLLTRLSAALAPHVRKYGDCNGTQASQGGYASIDESSECSEMRVVYKSRPIYNINPPQFALPHSLFWDKIFILLDQADFGALACTCRDWYQLWWERDLWERVPYISFSDRGLRVIARPRFLRQCWQPLGSKVSEEEIQSQFAKLLSHNRFSMVGAAKMTCSLGSSESDSRFLATLLSHKPYLRNLYIGGKGGSTLRWSQYKIFAQLVQNAPNLFELLIPSYPPKGIRALVRYHPNLVCLHLQNLVGPCTNGEWIYSFQSRDKRNYQLRVVSLINQGPVSFIHLKWVLFCCPNLHTLSLRGHTYLKDVPRDWREQIDELTSRSKISWPRKVVIDEGFEGQRSLYSFDDVTGTVTNSIWSVDYSYSKSLESKFNGFSNSYGPMK